MTPERLAVRAINQYRSRDILAYLGLRYYLANKCARRDLWATDVSTHLVKTRNSSGYFRSYHFKDIDAKSIVQHRSIYISGPNEIMAETALIDECSKHSSFHSLSCVSSYLFAAPESNEGIYQRYFSGFKQRHSSIADVCEGLKNEVVYYTDITKFYPSISKELALKAWTKACDNSSIDNSYRALGEKLLANYSQTALSQNDGLGLLTGPMFSHLIANLVLREIDETMSSNTSGRYWRYVDDIVLVGELNDVKRKREELRLLLEDIGLKLHTGDKDFSADTTEWLKGKNDFNGFEHKLWMNLASNIRGFLINCPNQRNDLAKAFKENGININLPNYEKAGLESSDLMRFSGWLRMYEKWARCLIHSLTVTELVEQALQARENYSSKIKVLLEKNTNVRGYERKRRITKLRYYAGRLSYLSPPDFLNSINSRLSSYPELHLLSTVMASFYTRDVSKVLALGSNASQAAAQMFCLRNDSIKCSLKSIGESEIQGLAIFELNGIHVDVVGAQVQQNPLGRFASGSGLKELMQDSDLFIRELACLHGESKFPRHVSILNSAFHRDEQLAFDVISQLQDSSYF